MSKAFQLAGIALIMVGVIVLMLSYAQGKSAVITTGGENIGGDGQIIIDEPETGGGGIDVPWHPTAEQDEGTGIINLDNIPETGGIDLFGFTFNVIELLALIIVIVGLFLMFIPV